jgi:hypothetical protein
MKTTLQQEWRQLREAARPLDRQTMAVLVVTPLLVILQMHLGDRDIFRAHLADLFPEAWRSLLAWAWWFGFQGVTGFVLPALLLRWGFHRRPAEIGLGRGDGRLATLLAVLYLPVVILGTWVLSADRAFQVRYPHFHPAALDWGVFLAYEALFLFYWMGWEYLWRGFLLFGTAPVFGRYAILVQAMPFALLHFNKPLAEGLLSVVGGLALGVLVWRCRAFWIAVPIHAAQMLVLDFWCSLRIRTGVQGIGLTALLELIRAL